MRAVGVGNRECEGDESPNRRALECFEETPEVRLLGAFLRETEPDVDRLHDAPFPEVLRRQHGAVETTAGQDRDTVVGVVLLRRTHASPRYTHPEVQVSWTTTWDSSGREGARRSQIHRARSSLVGFSSPGTSFR